MYLRRFIASRGLRFTLLNSAENQTYAKKINSLTNIRSKIQEEKIFLNKMLRKWNVAKYTGSELPRKVVTTHFSDY
jgi:hypothetical protein